MKSSAPESGLTVFNFALFTDTDLLYHSLGDTKKILNIISSISNGRDMVSDQMGLYFFKSNKGPRSGEFNFDV